VDLGCIEANEPDIGVLVMNLEGIAVNNPDVGRIDWFGKGWRCQEQRSDTG
jgi:hypothetical protein